MSQTKGEQNKFVADIRQRGQKILIMEKRYFTRQAVYKRAKALLIESASRLDCLVLKFNWPQRRSSAATEFKSTELFRIDVRQLSLDAPMSSDLAGEREIRTYAFLTKFRVRFFHIELQHRSMLGIN